MSKKVRCQICGKVGLSDAPESLVRHLKLAHHIGKGQYRGKFKSISDDEDCAVDILPCPRGDYEKRVNKEHNIKAKIERNKKLDRVYGKLQHKSVYWGRVLTSAFETKRK